SSPTQRTPVTPTLCSNLSAFKSLLRQSRALDDSIILRLNRASALSRSMADGRGSQVGENECEGFWKELTERWGERGEVLRFCDAAVAQGTGERELPVETGLSREITLKGRGESERDRRQIHTEIDVESIVRARSLAFFASRC
ncbi:caffeine-induced death protein 2, partial [Leucosporidium creatinivorum]